MTKPAPENSNDALNQRIDTLVSAVDRLIRVQQRTSRLGITAVVVIAGMLGAGVWHQANEDRAQSCKSQNATRGVVRDLLTAARNSTPESQRTTAGDAFYDAQLAKVTPIKC